MSERDHWAANSTGAQQAPLSLTDAGLKENLHNEYAGRRD